MLIGRGIVHGPVNVVLACACSCLSVQIRLTVKSSLVYVQIKHDNALQCTVIIQVLEIQIIYICMV